MKNIKTNTLLLAIVYFLCTTVYATDETVIIPDVNLKSHSAAVKKSHRGSYTGTSTQFSSEEIKNSPDVDLSQLLRQQQSMVRLTNNSGDASQAAMSIRGFGDNAVSNTLILIDGFPLTNPSLLAPNFNSIPLSDIERIDIFQGSEGSLWGDQAVGGVVNIITRHPKKFIANGMLSLGSYGANYENFLLGDKTDNGLFFKVFGLIGQTANYRDHNRQQDNNAAATAGWDYASGTFSVNVQTYGETIYFPGGLTEQQFHDNPRQAVNFKNWSRYRTELIQLLNRQELNGEWILESRLDHHQTQGDGLVSWNYNRQDATSSFNQRWLGNLPKNKITAGYNLQISSYDFSNARMNSSTSARQYDLFAQDVYAINQTLDLTLGARSTWQDNRIEENAGQSITTFNHVLVSEQGLRYHPTKELTFYLRRDGNFSLPKANEQLWVPANVKALDAQTGVSYEIGAAWNTLTQQMQIGLYRLALHDEIAFNPEQTETQPFGAYNNLDDTLRHGLTLTENYQLTSRAKFNAQFNYVDARFAAGPNSGNMIPAVPAITGNLGLDYDWTEHWQTQYALTYNGSSYAADDVTNSGRRLPGYWLNNIALQYLLEPWVFSFQVNNIFDTQYAAYAFVNPFSHTNTYYPAAGRNFLLTVKLNLD